VIAVAVYFFTKRAVKFFTITQESYRHYWGVKEWLLLHVSGGTIALFVGPFQFWAALRRRYIVVHRWMGRVYLFGVVLGSASAFYLALHSHYWSFGIALFALGVAWCGTSAMAVIAVLRRRIEIHKEWMIRSYVTTFAFVAFRIIQELPILKNVGTAAERLTTIAWLCWVIPLMFTEVVLQWKHVTGSSLTRRDPVPEKTA